MDEKLLGVKINYVTTHQAIDIVENWLRKKSKHYIVTPNPEMLVDVRNDKVFLDVLNSADLSIPDSPRLGWGSYLKSVNNPFLRLIYGVCFLFPHILPRFNYPVTRGVDLMEALLSLSNEKGFTTAYLGGSRKVADKLFKCLKLKYPRLKIVFCSGNMRVNENGEVQFDIKSNQMTGSKDIISPGASIKQQVSHTPALRATGRDSFNLHFLSQKIDIMFVAFGHKKQEKWMFRNINKLNTKVMIGVGGAFDYISGTVPRAPFYLRNLGLEWLFRGIIQPWRLKRFWKLFYFIYLVLFSKK